MSDPTPYAALGGADGVRRLVDAFYDRMDGDPAFARLRGVHRADLSAAREKLTLYLSGWLGGPNLYIERYGHPRLRARHLPFPIGTSGCRACPPRSMPAPSPSHCAAACSRRFRKPPISCAIARADRGGR